MKFLVTNVDTRTWCGRMHHPEPTDVGLVVRPMRMEAIYLGKDGNEGDGVFQEGVGENSEWVLLDTHPVEDFTEERIVRFWYCLTEDGRILQLHQSEIEWTEISERDFGGVEEFGKLKEEVAEKEAEIQRLLQTVNRFEDREHDSLELLARGQELISEYEETLQAANEEIQRLTLKVESLVNDLNDLSGKF